MNPPTDYEYRSETQVVPADRDSDSEFRLTLTRDRHGLTVVELELGLADAFDETADMHDLSLEQARRMAAILAELAAEGGELR